MNVYEILTEKILTLLNRGVIPWQKKWNATTQWPRNLISKRRYRGVNVFLLLMEEYSSPYWLSFRQASSKGWKIRKGEKGSLIVYYDRKEVQDRDNESDTKIISILRYSKVFNLAQCEGKGIEEPDCRNDEDNENGKPAELIVSEMPSRPEIKHGFRKAFYDKGNDYVGVPEKNKFVRGEDYFATLFHELVHATGHATRLNRFNGSVRSRFGSDDYGMEELIAEMGSAFLCAEAGIIDRTIENSASYLQGWIEAIKQDSRLILIASSSARKATEFILGTGKDSHEPR